MIPRITTLIALLALLLSGPAFGAESLGGVPQVVDAVADKPVIAPPSQLPGPPLAPDKNGREAAAEVENQRRFNELRCELLDDRRESPDPEKGVDWQFIFTIIGIVVAIIGTIVVPVWLHYRNSGKAVEDVAAGVARGVAEGLKKFAEINAADDSKNPAESGEIAERVRRDPAAPRIDREIAAAVQLQQQGKIKEAIEKWRSIATVAGEEDRPLQARAWFSIGYLRSVGEGADLEAAVDAYTKAIELNPALTEAYNNRGSVKDDLGQPAAALADFDQAIELDPILATAYFNRGNARRELGQPAAALADFDRAIALNPDYVTAYSNRGNAKSGLGQPAAALADFDRAIELAPTDAVAYNNRAVTNVSLGRINEARADLQQAVVLAREAGNNDLAERLEDALGHLGNNEAP